MGPIEVSQPLFDANVVWMDERPLDPSRVYVLKHASRVVTAEVDRALNLNEIGSVVITTARSLVFDSYADNRTLGSFVLIDPATNFTAGAGMIASNESEAATRRRAAPPRGGSRWPPREAASEAEAEEAVRRILEEMLT